MPGIATNPVAGDIHVNRPLTNFSQKYLQSADKFASLVAFPNLPVSMQSDLYWEFDRGDFYRDQAEERADGSETAGGGFKVSTSPYFARVYGFHKDVTDRQRANQDQGINLDQSATQFVMQKLLLLRETQFVTNFLNTNGVWTGGVTPDQDVIWGAAASNPVADIRAAITAVQGTTGYRPNRMLIGRTAYDTLLENDEILARISGGAVTSQPAIVQRQLLAQLFELDMIHVTEAVSNTAVEGAADTISYIGGDHAVVYYAPPSVGLEEPTAGVQFSWTGYTGATSMGQRIKRFRMEPNAADRVEGEMAFDYKQVAPDLGARFIDCSDAA